MHSFETINIEILNDAEVTVVCPTYNHIKYIEKCIGSLASQVTTFRYCILIHDDASDDGTKELIKRECELLSEKVCAIIEKTNLYSLGRTHRDVVGPFLSGRFVAVCEGDDFWTSRNKLQAEYDYLSAHPEYSLCLHQAVEYDDFTKESIGVRSFSNEERDISLQELLNKWAVCGATNSIMMRKELYIFPRAFSGWGVGDYPSVIYAALNGKVRFIPRSLSAYRIGSVGSWTVKNTDRARKLSHTERLIWGLSKADAYSLGRHHAEFTQAQAILMLELLALKRQPIKLICSLLTTGKTSRVGLRKDINLVCKCILPDYLIHILKKNKNRIKSNN